MSEQAYQFDYRPTMKELRSGGVLVYRNLYKGPWRIALAARSLFLVLSTFIVGLVVTMITFQSLEVSVSDAPVTYYGLVAVIAFGIIVSLSMLYNRPAKVYFEKLQGINLQANISAAGIELASADWTYFARWSMLDSLIEKNGLMVFRFAHLGFILSDRMFSEIGEPPEVRKQIREWFYQGQRG
jgi:hypothetical protein